MIKKDIIYNNLLDLLRALTTDGSEFEDYYSTLGSEDKRSMLMDLSDSIDAVKREINKSKIEDKVFGDFANLNLYLETLSLEFPDYPHARVKEIQVIIKLVGRLHEENNDTPLNLQENINETEFSLVEIQKPIKTDSYVYYDPVHLKNSIVMVDLRQPTSIDAILSNGNFPIELIIRLLEKIGKPEIALNESKYALVRRELDGLENSIYACLCLHIVKSGELVHEPYVYSNPPKVNPNWKIDTQHKYQQFNDSLVILSEYNSQKDILDKYLRIYHLIENFMFKKPLVSLEKKHSGNVFSIRDFQRIYDTVSTSEFFALKELFKGVLQEEYSPGIKFESMMFNKFKDLHPNVIANKSHIDKILSILRVRNNNNIEYTYDSIQLININLIFSQLVYGFRNAIVHNRETEFHLTHKTLITHPEINDSGKHLIQEFLIPVLEEIVFYLIIVKNDLVWYDNSTIKLYDEN